MKKLLKSRGGNVPILTVGFIFVLLLTTFLIMEMGGAFENYEYAESVLQRSCNTAVEANINDAYRADKILLLDTDGAKADFRTFAYRDMPSRFQLTIDSVTAEESPPSMEATGTVTFSTLFDQYGFDDLTFHFKVVATNYDLVE